MQQQRRVVVTGLGVISPVGNEVETAWRNVLAGKSGISLIDTFDVSQFSTRFAGQVRDFEPLLYGITAKDVRKMDTFIQYGIAAAVQAIKDAGLSAQPENADRI